MATAEKIGNPSANVKNMLENHADHAAISLQNTIEKISEATQPAADYISSNAHVAVDKLRNVATLATEAIAATGEKVYDLEQEIVKRGSAYIQAKPITMFCVALAAGFIVSRLLRKQ